MDIAENPFETLQFQKAYEEFCEKYIFKNGGVYDEKENEMWDCFVSALCETRLIAFKVGFRTAIDLLMNKEK